MLRLAGAGLIVVLFGLWVLVGPGLAVVVAVVAGLVAEAVLLGLQLVVVPFAVSPPALVARQGTQRALMASGCRAAS